MSENYRPIRESLLAEAFAEVCPLVQPQLNGPRAAYVEHQDIPVELVRLLVEYIDEGGEPSAAGEDLKLWLQGEERCRECGGDGFIWDQDLHDLKVKEAQAKGGVEWDWFDHDSAGYRTCPVCNGNRLVPLAVTA